MYAPKAPVAPASMEARQTNRILLRGLSSVALRLPLPRRTPHVSSAVRNPSDV
ncbi:hypothetical protein M3J09_011270 [Ascochyta lentis]